MSTSVRSLAAVSPLGVPPAGAPPPTGLAQGPEGLAAPAAPGPPAQDPVLCSHCGRTASNGISCQGICVADSGY
ncbi:MAG: hypothetical protein VKO19_04640 [Cyanobacteriota bacterium]|nr:hypothetical protein [Cyanobacteriota bacterium]